MFQLERYRGRSTRYDCPRCGERKSFVRYIDDNGHYLADDVGRCNRESKCGYHYPPRRFFADGRNSESKKAKDKAFNKDISIEFEARIIKSSHENHLSHSTPDFIPSEYLLQTLTDYERNSLVQFLIKLFSANPSVVETAVTKYLVGTLDGYTVFPKIDRKFVLRSAKLIKFDPESGKRLKHQFSISSLQAKLKHRGRLRSDFEIDKDVFFGEHLLETHLELPVAVVESEKTALIASMCQTILPEMIWLASGSKRWLKAHRLERIAQDRKIVLYPDGDAFHEWSEIAFEARRLGITVQLSTVIDEYGSAAEKAEGLDIADVLISLIQSSERLTVT